MKSKLLILRTISYFLILISFISCHHEKHFIIKGTIKNTRIAKVYLAEMNLTYTKVIDSTLIDKDGTFIFSSQIDAPCFYQLIFNRNSFIILLAEPKQKITLNVDANKSTDNYTIEGSQGSEQVKLLNEHIYITRLKLDSLELIINQNINKPGFDSIHKRLNNEYLKIILDQRNFSINFILENLKSLASIIALYQQINDSVYVLNQNRDLQYFNLVSDTLMKYYPNSKPVNVLRNTRIQLNEAYNMLKIEALKRKTKIVSVPDIALQNINGDTVHLNALKRKCILINFWDPSNNDCIYAMQGIKKLYSNYKKKGFEVYNICLAENRSEWVEYMKANVLPGINVFDQNIEVSYYARLYNVKQLPASYLIGPDNKITGKDIFGENLKKNIEIIFH